MVDRTHSQRCQASRMLLARLREAIYSAVSSDSPRTRAYWGEAPHVRKMWQGNMHFIIIRFVLIQGICSLLVILALWHGIAEYTPAKDLTSAPTQTVKRPLHAGRLSHAIRIITLVQLKKRPPRPVLNFRAPRTCRLKKITICRIQDLPIQLHHHRRDRTRCRRETSSLPFQICTARTRILGIYLKMHLFHPT